MKARLIALTLLFFVGFTFQNCEDDCGGFSGGGLYFDIQGITVSHQSNHSANEYAFSDYNGMRVAYDVVYHSLHTPKEPSWNFSMMNTATACSPVGFGEYGSKTEILTKITVTTLNDFDGTHIAGDIINDLITIQADSKTMNVADFSLVNQDLIQSDNFLLTLDKAPEASNDFQVKIEIELSTGEKYETTSEVVTFL